MNTKELKKLLEAQKLQTYFLLNKNETFTFFNGLVNLEMKYDEDNILLHKEIDLQAYSQYNETPNFWLSLAEQMRLQYLKEYKTNKLNMILFLVNSNLALLEPEKERLIKREANLQLEDEQIYKVNKEFISFFAEDLSLWLSSNSLPHEVEYNLYNKLNSDFIHVKVRQIYHNSFEYEILDELKDNNKNKFISYLPNFTWNNNSIYLQSIISNEITKEKEELHGKGKQ